MMRLTRYLLAVPPNAVAEALAESGINATLYPVTGIWEGAVERSVAVELYHEPGDPKDPARQLRELIGSLLVAWEQECAFVEEREADAKLFYPKLPYAPWPFKVTG